MPQLREYRRFGARYMLANLVSMLPFIPIFIILWHRASTGRIDAWFWAGIAAFVVGAAFGLWWQWHRERRMACPQCGTAIIRTGHLAANEPINFICTRCDVEWVTGLRKADG